MLISWEYAVGEYDAMRWMKCDGWIELSIQQDLKQCLYFFVYGCCKSYEDYLGLPFTVDSSPCAPHSSHAIDMRDDNSRLFGGPSSEHQSIGCLMLATLACSCLDAQIIRSSFHLGACAQWYRRSNPAYDWSRELYWRWHRNRDVHWWGVDPWPRLGSALWCGWANDQFYLWWLTDWSGLSWSTLTHPLVCTPI